MRLLFDENVPKLVVDHFRHLSIDLKTVNELNLISHPDSEIVRRSNKLRRTLVTRDLGLIKITSYSDATKFGLIFIRYIWFCDPSIGQDHNRFCKKSTKQDYKRYINCN